MQLRSGTSQQAAAVAQASASEAVIKADICIIGAGSGGLSVAAAAAAFGRSVVLIERNNFGGEVLQSGCIPSRALAAVANRAHAMRSAGALGIDAREPEVDLRAVSAHVAGIMADINVSMDGSKINLFKNDIVPTPDTLLSEFEVADYTSYAEQTLVTWPSGVYITDEGKYAINSVSA